MRHISNKIKCYIYFVSLIFIIQIGFAENVNSMPSPTNLNSSLPAVLLPPPDPNSLEWETYWQTLRDKLVAKEVTLSTWKKQTAIYFEENSFNPIYLQLWDTILRQTPEFQSDLFMYATVFGIQSLIKEVQKTPPNPFSIVLSSQFLLKNLESLKESQIIQIAEIIEEDLKKKPIPLEKLWNALTQQLNITGNTPDTINLSQAYETIIYLCITLSAYLPANKLTGVVQLPEPMKSFYNDFYIFIFDGGILTESHYHSLRSIFSCFPPRLHNIRMILFPERIGISATRLYIPPQYGIVTDLSFLPMEVMSNPMEFPVRYGNQIAPEFSIQTAIQIIRAIQFVQFRLRPELLFRRNALLMNAKARNYNYTRPTIPPEVYFNNPDELLPLSSYLWILNTEKTLQMISDLLRIRQFFTNDVYLLLADMLSGGRDVTLTFFMDETGYLSVREAPVIRAPIDEGYPAVMTILPDRFMPTFKIKEGREDTTSGITNFQNTSIQQGSNFSSGFSQPIEGNTKETSEANVLIEMKGN